MYPCHKLVHIGEGSVSYTIQPKANSPSGTEITNATTIIFDWNEPIDTPVVRNTIDSEPPVSQINPLPSITREEFFEVSWTGSDEAEGSGLVSYDIFVSIDSGPYSLWLNAVKSTSAVFNGEDGHTYSFYSIAMDNVGHIELAPAIADAETTIQLNQPPIAAAGGPYTVDEGGSVLLDASGTIDPNLPGDVLTYEWDFDSDGQYDDATGIYLTFSAALMDGPSSTTVGLKVTDSYGESDTDTAIVQVINVAPSVVVDNAIVNVDEGQTASNTGTYSDPGDDIVTLTVSVGNIIDNGNSTWDWLFGTNDGPDQSQVVVITATDSDGAETTTSFELLVTNVAPSLADVTFEIAENHPNGTVVGAISGADPGEDTLTYSIVGGTGASAFAIDSSSGQITVSDATQLDYETTPYFTLDVQTMDDDGATGNATVTISLLNQASITGTTFVDVNENGVYEANEPGIDGITIELLDENGDPILDTQNNPVTAITSDGGFYLFEDLNPGVYQLHEIQSTGVDDGEEILGFLGGTIPANDTMRLTLERIYAADYIFAELGQSVASGDTATIGFWQNKRGQALIAQGGAVLANWLTSNFGNVFGDAFVGASGDDVASFYRNQLFRQKSEKSAGPAKVDAQFMAVALATYFTSSNLAGNVASDYGFNITNTGIGTKVVNVGNNGAAFGVANSSNLTIMQLLLAANDLTDQPDNLSGFTRIYDLNGDIDEMEAFLCRLANEVYSAINEQGNI